MIACQRNNTCRFAPRGARRLRDVVFVLPILELRPCFHFFLSRPGKGRCQQQQQQRGYDDEDGAVESSDGRLDGGRWTGLSLGTALRRRADGIAHFRQQQGR